MSANPRRKGELVQSSTAHAWAVYESESDSLHELNSSARAVWELCDGETAPEEMAAAISEVTGMADEESLRNVETTLQHLEASGLVAY